MGKVINLFASEQPITEIQYDPENPLCQKGSCYRCGKVVTILDPLWRINQVGEYGSQYDGDRVCIEICEECLLKFINYKKEA